MLTRYHVTTGYRVARPSSGTRTDRIVIDHSASGVTSASAGTRVLALVAHASLRRRAFSVAHALGSAIRRNTQVTRQTRAHRSVSERPASAVRAARMRFAGLFDNRLLRARHGWNGPARPVGIASEALGASANWDVIDHSAF